MVLATAGSSVAAYRTYDFIQHDNDFCVSCHLMQDPFDRFQASAHRDMSCKACHQPSPIDRFAMGMRQVLKHPVEITIRELAERVVALCDSSSQLVHRPLPRPYCVLFASAIASASSWKRVNSRLTVSTARPR